MSPTEETTIIFHDAVAAVMRKLDSARESLASMGLEQLESQQESLRTEVASLQLAKQELTDEISQLKEEKKSHADEISLLKEEHMLHAEATKEDVTMMDESKASTVDTTAVTPAVNNKEVTLEDKQATTVDSATDKKENNQEPITEDIQKTVTADIRENKKTSTEVDQEKTPAKDDREDTEDHKEPMIEDNPETTIEDNENEEVMEDSQESFTEESQTQNMLFTQQFASMSGGGDDYESEVEKDDTEPTDNAEPSNDPASTPSHANSKLEGDVMEDSQETTMDFSQASFMEETQDMLFTQQPMSDGADDHESEPEEPAVATQEEKEDENHDMGGELKRDNKEEDTKQEAAAEGEEDTKHAADEKALGITHEVEETYDAKDAAAEADDMEEDTQPAARAAGEEAAEVTETMEEDSQPVTADNDQDKQPEEEDREITEESQSSTQPAAGTTEDSQLSFATSPGTQEQGEYSFENVTMVERQNQQGIEGSVVTGCTGATGWSRSSKKRRVSKAFVNSPKKWRRMVRTNRLKSILLRKK